MKKGLFLFVMMSLFLVQGVKAGLAEEKMAAAKMDAPAMTEEQWICSRPLRQIPEEFP